jgi:asparagine synthetase B (glutamine-hydrolysing)
MPGLLGVFTADSVPVDIERLIETINLGGRSLVQSWQLPDGFMAVAALRETPLKGPRYYQDDRYLACFTGDLIGAEEIPWASIISAFMSEAYSDLAHLKGTFGIAVFDKSTRCIILVSDRKAQVPLCYSIDEKGVVFSTSMATFCRLPAARPFNVEFLYETMFFNFPIGETTFLTGVKRLTPGSVLTVDLASREVTPHRYVSRFRRAETVLVGDRALERARSVLERRVAEHFGSGFGVALGLSGGADSRLIMSLCPSSVRDSVYAYTFGIRGCRDLQEGARVPAALCPLDAGQLRAELSGCSERHMYESGVPGTISCSYGGIGRHGTRLQSRAPCC